MELYRVLAELVVRDLCRRPDPKYPSVGFTASGGVPGSDSVPTSDSVPESDGVIAFAPALAAPPPAAPAPPPAPSPASSCSGVTGISTLRSCAHSGVRAWREDLDWRLRRLR